MMVYLKFPGKGWRNLHKYVEQNLVKTHLSLEIEMSGDKLVTARQVLSICV